MSETATAEKTFTQKDIEAERAHAEHFKQLAADNAAKLKIFEGIDPDGYKKDREELEAMRKKKALATPEELDAWKAQTEADVRSKVQKDLDEAKTEAQKLKQVNKELTVTDRVFAAAASHVMPDMTELVKDQIRKHGDLNEKGEIVFKDAAGKEMYAPGSTTQLMNTDQFVESLRGKFPSAFKATDKGGAKQGGEKQAAGTYAGRQLSRSEIEALPDKGKQYFRENPAAARAYSQGK